MDNDENLINNFANTLRDHHKQRTFSLYSENHSRSDVEKYEIKDVISSVAEQLKAIQNADSLKKCPSGKGMTNLVKRSTFLPVNMVPVEHPPAQYQSHKFETQCVLDTQLINVIEDAEAIIDAEKGITQEFDTTFCYKEQDNCKIAQKPCTVHKNNHIIDKPKINSDSDKTNDWSVCYSKTVKHVDVVNGMTQEFDTTFCHKDLDNNIEENNDCHKNQQNDNIQVKNDNIHTENYRGTDCGIVGDTFKIKYDEEGLFVNQLSLTKEKAITDVIIRNFAPETNAESNSIDICDNFDTQSNFYFGACEDDSNNFSQTEKLINNPKSIELEEPKSPILNNIRPKAKSNTPSPLIFRLQSFEKFEMIALPIIENYDFETAKRVINSQILNKELFIHSHAEAVLGDRDKDIQKNRPIKSYMQSEIPNACTENNLNLTEDSMLFSSDEENDATDNLEELPLKCNSQNSFNDETDTLEGTMYVGFQTASNKSIQIPTAPYHKAKTIFDNLANIETNFVEAETTTETNFVEASQTVATIRPRLQLNHVSMKSTTTNIVADCITTANSETLNMSQKTSNVSHLKPKDTIPYYVDQVKNNGKNMSGDSENLLQLYDLDISDNNKIKLSEEINPNQANSEPNANVQQLKDTIYDKNYAEHLQIDNDLMNDHIVAEFNTDLIPDINLNKIDKLTKCDKALKATNNVVKKSELDMNLMKPITNDFVGFRTATKKMIKISAKGLMKTKNIFENIDNDDPLPRKSEKQSFESPLDKTHSKSQNFEENSVKSNINKIKTTKQPVAISIQKLNKAKKIFQNTDNNSESLSLTEKPFHSAQNAESNAFRKFTTASNKTVEISESATAKTKNTFQDIENNKKIDDLFEIPACDIAVQSSNAIKGFTTASNKSVKISESAIAKTKHIFQEIDNEPKKYNNESTVVSDDFDNISKEERPYPYVSQNAICQGFKTASNKFIQISTDPLIKTKKIFEDIFIDVDHKRTTNTSDESDVMFQEKQPCPITNVPQNVLCQGFKTAADKPLGIPAKALTKSKQIFRDLNDEESNIVNNFDDVTKEKQPYPIDNIPQNVICEGFKTAGNKLVEISTEPLIKTKQIFQDIFNDVDHKKSTTTIISDDSDGMFQEKQPCPITNVPQIFLCQGFKTAAHKPLGIPAKAIAKSKKIFQDLNDEESNILNDFDDVIKANQPYLDIHKPQNAMYQGFKTAANKSLGIPAKALEKSKKIFRDLNDEESNIMNNFDDVLKEKQPYPIANISQNSVCQGFKTASNKLVKISTEPLIKTKQIFQNIFIDVDHKRTTTTNDESDGMFQEKEPCLNTNVPQNVVCQGFKTAANKPLGIPAKALEKSKKIFRDLNDEESNIVKNFDDVTKEKQPYPIDNIPQNVICEGFKTAGNKLVEISTEPLIKTKQNFQDIFNDVDHKRSTTTIISDDSDGMFQEKQPCPITNVSQIFLCQGFKTAAHKPLGIPAKAIAKSKKIFQDLNDEESNILNEYDDVIKANQPYLDIHKPQNAMYQGFKTAGNKAVEISEQDLLKSKKAVENVHKDCEEKQIRENLIGKQPETVTRKQMNFIGFHTACNKKVDVSENALLKSRQALQNIDSDLKSEHFDLMKKGNNMINISEEALRKCGNKFSESGVISEKNVFEDFNTEIIKDFEDTVCTEDFMKDETPKGKRSGSPILSFPNTKKKKKFETPFITKKFVAPINRRNTIDTTTTNVYEFNENYKKIKQYTLKDVNEMDKLINIKNVDPYISNFQFETLLDFVFIGDRNDIDNDKWTTDKIKRYFSDSVNKKFIPDGWIENHLRMIIWKLVSYEIRFPDVMKNVCTVRNVLEQLKYRYKRELYNVERPALRKILEKDEVSTKGMVLCVAGLLRKEEEGKKKLEGENVSSVTKQTQNIELLLTDGWYTIKATSDRMIDRLVCEGKITVGMKLAIHGAELSNCEQGKAPWEDTSSVRLKIWGNSTRRARWDARLGFHGRGAMLSRLSAVRPEGGRAARLRALVTRVYPTLYIEKYPDGSTREYCGTLAVNSIWGNSTRRARWDARLGFHGRGAMLSRLSAVRPEGGRAARLRALVTRVYPTLYIEKYPDGSTREYCGTLAVNSIWGNSTRRARWDARLGFHGRGAMLSRLSAVRPEGGRAARLRALVTRVYPTLYIEKYPDGSTREYCGTLAVNSIWGNSTRRARWDARLGFHGRGAMLSRLSAVRPEGGRAARLRALVTRVYPTLYIEKYPDGSTREYCGTLAVNSIWGNSTRRARWDARLGFHGRGAMLSRLSAVRPEGGRAARLRALVTRVYPTLYIEKYPDGSTREYCGTLAVNSIWGNSTRRARWDARLGFHGRGAMLSRLSAVRPEGGRAARLRALVTRVYPTLYIEKYPDGSTREYCGTLAVNSIWGNSTRRARWDARLGFHGRGAMLSRLSAVRPEGGRAARLRALVTRVYPTLYIEKYPDGSTREYCGTLAVNSIWGNSTRRARWDARLGFHGRGAMLSRLSAVRPEGGRAARLRALVTRVYPTLYIEKYPDGSTREYCGTLAVNSIWGNSTRRARWDARLGFHGRGAMLSRLSAVRPEGGRAARLRALVTRVYPTLYIEKYPDGSTREYCGTLAVNSIWGNSTRRARWDARLGFHGRGAMLSRLSAVRPEGGRAARLRALVTRVYPTLYIEKYPDGSTREYCGTLAVNSIWGNSTRRARWDARLGFHGRGAMLSRLSAVRPEGGRAARLRALVTRVYPTLYIEKYPDGSTLTRSERLEDIHQMKYETERQMQMERLYEELQRFSDQESQDSEGQYPVDTAMESGSQISRLMKKSRDREEFRAQLTSSQAGLLQQYTLKQREKLAQDLQDRLRRLVEERGLDAPRNVVPLVKIRVADVETRGVTKAMVTIWKPNEMLLEMLTEGTWIDLYNVVPTSIRYSEIQISAGRQSTFRISKLKETEQLQTITKTLKRHCYTTKDLQNPSMNTDYNEVDTVGLIFMIEPQTIEFEMKNQTFQNVYLTDADKNIICVNFWGGIEKFGFQNILETGQVVACVNLQKRAGNTRKTIPQYRATEFTYFTKAPKNESIRKMAANLTAKFSCLDKRKFIDDCVVLKNNYHNFKCGNIENVSPYRLNTSDYNVYKNKIFIDSPLVNKCTDVNFNLTGLDFESTFKQTDTQELPQQTLLRKRKVNEKIAKLKMYGEPPPLSPIHLINKSTIKSFKSPFTKNDILANVASPSAIPHNRGENKSNTDDCHQNRKQSIDGNTNPEVSPQRNEYRSCVTSTNALPQNRVDNIDSSPVYSLNRTYVKRPSINPVKLNFSNAIDSSITDPFAEDFDGSPPLSLDVNFIT